MSSAATAPPLARRAPGAGRAWLLACLAVALLACLAYTATELYLLDGALGFPLDDSWIHLQFARQLAAGRGLSYDGESMVTGSTAPLWTGLLALAFVLPGGAVAAAKGMAVALHLATVAATWRLARELDLSPGLAGLAAGLTAGSSWLAWAALAAMEVPLFCALSLTGIALHVRERRRPERPPLALPVLGLAMLARPEGALLFVLALADALLGGAAPPRLRLRRAAIGLAWAALAVAPALLFYTAVGGSPLPSTFAAKTAGVQRWLPNLGYVHTVVGILFQVQPWTTVLAAGGAAALAARLGGARDCGLLPALWAFALPLAYSTLSPKGGAGIIAGNFGRYFFPLLPVVAVLGVVALEPAARLLAARERSPGRPSLRSVRVAAVALLVAPTLWTLVLGAARYAQSVGNVQDSDVRMAKWLAPRLPAEAVLAVNDIGALQYFLPNRILDLAGIVNPEARRYARAAAAAGSAPEAGTLRFLEERRPDYLVVFPSWFPWLTARSSLFRPIFGLTIPDNITMGGDELVVFATPWTRHPLRDVPAAPGEDARVGPQRDQE